MAIITISRGSYSKGKEIAERVAKELGYRCLSRDVILAASDEFNVPEVKLVKALHDAPSVLDRFTDGKERYISFFRKALLEAMREDDVVYHGLAGHFYLQGVDHVLKVRIVADMDERAGLEAEREGISEEEARHRLKKDDEERNKWGRVLYGIDTSDPTLYDLVIRIRKLSVDDAVETICRLARSGQFETTPESQAVLEKFLREASAEAG